MRFGGKKPPPGYSGFRGSVQTVVPDGWFTKESITLLAPDGQANVIASSEPLDPSIGVEQYAQVQGDLLRKEFPGYREFSYRSVTAFGQPGYLRHFEWTPPDGVRVTQLQVYTVTTGRGWTATATTPSTNFHRFEVAFYATLAGLSMEPRS